MTKIADKQSLKQLQTQLSVLEGKREAIKTKVSLDQKELTFTNKQITELKNKIQVLEYREDKSIEVSEHALLRYCERVLGIDLELIKSKIINDLELNRLISILGSTGTYPVKDFKIKMKDNTIITVMKD